MLYRLAPLGVISAAGVAVMIGASGYSQDQTDGRAVGWSLFIVLCALVHLGLCLAFRRAAPPDADWRRWMRPFNAMAVVEGIGWGVGALILTAADNSRQALVILVSWTSVSAGGAIVFGAHIPTYLAFLYPAMLPHVFLTLRYRYPYFGLLAGLEVVFLTLIPLIALQFSRQLVDGLHLCFANLDLAEDLQRQKVVAEQANLAKSQFLAAASHDLRQPVHALGLFVGALRGRKMDRESRRLLEQIDKSVAALDELFVGLLDISKLDAGAVQPRIETVAIHLTLERLLRDYSVARLQRRGCGQGPRFAAASRCGLCGKRPGPAGADLAQPCVQRRAPYRCGRGSEGCAPAPRHGGR